MEDTWGEFEEKPKNEAAGGWGESNGNDGWGTTKGANDGWDTAGVANDPWDGNQEEEKEKSKAIKCYNCQEEGHYSSDCTNPKKAQVCFKCN